MPQLALRSGRRVSLHEVADGRDDRTVVFCHPAPGAGMFDPDPEQTAARGIRLIGLDRPGYGDSEPVATGAWASVASAADDLAEVLGQLGLGPVGLAGWSAGGRVALACAARHPELVDRVVVFGTPAPDEAIPWISPAHREMLEGLRGLPPQEVHARLETAFAPMLPADPRWSDALDLLGRSDADDGALAFHGAAERLGAMMAAALAQGAKGMAADVAGYCLRPWGFELGDVRAKTLFLYGSRDPVAANRHGSWWQRAVPGSRVEMAPGAGHLLVVPMWRRALAHLAPRQR